MSFPSHVTCRDGQVIPITTVRLPANQEAVYPRRCLYCLAEGVASLTFANQSTLAAHFRHSHNAKVKDLKQQYARLVTKTEAQRDTKREPVPAFFWPYFYDNHGPPSDDSSDDENVADSPANILVSISRQKHARPAMEVHDAAGEPPPKKQRTLDYHAILPQELADAFQAHDYAKVSQHKGTLIASIEELQQSLREDTREIARLSARVASTRRALFGYENIVAIVSNLLDDVEPVEETQ